ncbi:unnamed protein product [Allacma fusca]|uniref:BED-type domain-containing protein n=1 Tax=Allacma fusca TaxID=39272 RepID=A0A8J2PJF9_9HEXA|nr:unnamed protein product [Allacma fusca]
MEHEESESDSEDSVTVVEEDPELDNNYQPKRKKPKSMRSKYYNFFVWMPDSKDSRTGKWKCKEKACGSELMIPVGGGTSNLKNHITRRHRHLLAESSDGEVYIIATVLDPRCNLDFCKKANWKKEWIDNSKKVVTEIWKARYKGPDPGVSGSSADESDSRTTSIFDNMFGPASASRKTADDELNKYLSQKSVKSDMLKKELTGVDGALGWWKIHQTEYPRLSRMAKDYLGILGSGVAIEQFFCTGGDLVSPRRKGLASKSITVSMCLKNWKKNEKSQRQSYYRGMKSKLIGDEEIQEFEL